MTKHTKLVPQVKCLQCSRMSRLHTTTPTATIYGCAGGHTRRIERTDGQRIPVNGPTKPAA